MVHPARTEGPVTRISGPCQLEELDLQACPIGPEGLRALCGAFAGTQVASCLKIMDLGHCGHLHDQVLQQLIETLVIPNGTRWSSAIQASGRDSEADSGANEGEQARSLLRSSSAPTPLSQTLQDNEEAVVNGKLLDQSPPRARLPMTVGFFTNLRQLDLKSTRIGDGTAWLLAQALVQTWTMIHSLTILDPIAMSVQGICWILDALCENSTVQEVGIGKSDISQQADLELFGSGLANLMETNRRIRSLTTLGAPLGPIAKGMLLNQSLHSLYLIRSKGQFEDLQLMGQALGFTRTLLIFRMGGSDDSLLGPLRCGLNENQAQEVADGVAGSISPFKSTDSSQQVQQDQESQEQQQRENVYHDFHISHQQRDQPHHLRLQRHGSRHQSRGHNRSLSKYIESLLRPRFSQARQSGGTSSSVPGKHQVTPGGDFKSGSEPVIAFPLRTLSSSNQVVNTHVADGKTTIAATGATPPGMSGLWTRHPIIEGVRRNHSLLKVVLDTIATTVTITTAGPPSAAASGNQPNMRVPGTEDRLSRDIGRGEMTAAAQEFYHTQQELQHLQLQQQQVLHKKIASNRKLLRERGRIGWEELKLLGVDDDIIREVCEDP